ncbi:NAD(+) diphosphatase [Pseudomonas sp. 5P_3.1_Bac2]|uniref:NAD(+) diphosphatase n=1 Tax=Pseudomonas sp. 5P_3.1_Bac2 TaxID=2971617 RepID=UPI0021C87C1F|nr:NAD(+) diphosphatase [Pseudomonas sp. 5P_3.1_Bac2]MCU1717460.1 NAD(+) diphosphatase [Pseudomonas sp. 5P_3.1_Bac2]
MSRWQSALIDPQLPGGWVLAHCKQQFLADDNGVLFPREWLKRQGLPVISEQGLGHLGDDPIYLLELAQPATVLGCSWLGLRQFMLQDDDERFHMLSYATQVGTWAREHRFCGSCGAANVQIPGERAMYCQTCDLRNYPRLSPSMIVLLSRGDEILLARSPRFVPGMYSTLAGFVEPGETVEHCVAREVREEVGLEVHNIRYMGSQPWPFPHSLMFGFHAEYAGGELRLQEDEIEDAQWFNVRQLPPLPASRSIARYLIDSYVAQRLGLAQPVLPS